MYHIRLPTLEGPQPLRHRSNLPQMRLLDELWLRLEIQNAVAIPVMARAGDQILGMEVGRIAGRGVVGVIADVEPDVDVAVDEGETIGREIESSVMIVVSQIWRAGYGIELALRKRPFTPLLGVVDLEDAGDQGRSSRGCDLICALFRAGAVKVAAICGIRRIGIESLILRAKASCAVDRDTGTEREECLFHVLSVISKVGPRFAIAVFTEHSVDRCDVCRGIQISDIGAERKEILGTVCLIPIKLLPCIRRIIHWPTEWESNCHREISVVCHRLKAEDCLEFNYRFSVVCSKECIKLVDDVIDTCNAVLRSELLDWSVPLRIGEHGMNYGATSNAAVEQASVLLDRECSLGSCQTSSVQDPGSTRCRQIAFDAREGGMSGEVCIVRNCLLGSQVG